MIRLIFRFKASARIACVSSLERVVVVVLLLLVAGSLPRTARSPRGSFSFPLSLFKSFLLTSTIPHIYTFKSILKRSRRPTKRRKHAERRLLLHHPLSSFFRLLSLPLSLSSCFAFIAPSSRSFFSLNVMLIIIIIFFVKSGSRFFCGTKKQNFSCDEVFPIKANTRDTHARARRQIRRTHTERESSDELFLLLFF